MPSNELSVLNEQSEVIVHQKQQKTNKHKYYTVNNLAEILNLAPNTIRNWTETLDFFIQCDYDKQGQRLYTDEHLEKFWYIYKLKVEYGIPLKTIKPILEGSQRWNKEKTVVDHSTELEVSSNKIEALSNDIKNLSNVVKVIIDVINQNTQMAELQTQQLREISEKVEETSNQIRNIEANYEEERERYKKIEKKLNDQDELLRRQTDLVVSLRESLFKRQEENTRKGIKAKLKSLFKRNKR